MANWRIKILDTSLDELCELDDIVRPEAILRLNDVGTLEFSIHRNSEYIPHIVQGNHWVIERQEVRGQAWTEVEGLAGTIQDIDDEWTEGGEATEYRRVKCYTYEFHLATRQILPDGVGILEDEYDISNLSNRWKLIEGAGGDEYDAVAQCVALSSPTGKYLHSFDLWLQKRGASAVWGKAYIYDIAGTPGSTATPTGSALMMGDPVKSIPDIKADWSSGATGNYDIIHFDFPAVAGSGQNLIDLTGKSGIAIVLFSEGSEYNHISVAIDDSSPTHAGNAAHKPNGAWTADAGIDLPFRLYICYSQNPDPDKKINGKVDDAMKEMVRDSVLSGHVQDSDRELSLLAIEADAGASSYYDTLVASFDTLLVALQQWAERYDVDFGIVRTSSGYQFKTWSPQRGSDKTSSVVFTLRRGNLQSYRFWSHRSVRQNFLYAGGKGEKNERIVRSGYHGASVPTGEDRYEGFVDCRDLQDHDQVEVRLQEELSRYGDGAEGAEITVLSTEGTKWGDDWSLGDKVKVGDTRWNREFDAQIREIRFTWSEGGVESIQPILGTPIGDIKQWALQKVGRPMHRLSRWDPFHDLKPPPEPGNLSHSIEYKIVGDGFLVCILHLDWDDVGSADFDYYEVEMQVSGQARWYSAGIIRESKLDKEVQSNESWYVRVRAVDRAGNASPWADFNNGAVIAVGVTGTAPAPPASVSASGFIQGIVVDWTPNTEADLWGYEVYAGSSPSFTPDTSTYTNRVYKGSSSIFVHRLAVGTTRYYRVRAGNRSNVWSSFAAEVNATAGAISVGDIDEIAIQGWQMDLAFSATDYNTVAWTVGSIWLTDDTTYSITAGNTGNMTAITYIYLDIGVSQTVLQTSTTASSAVGSGKILIAVAEDVSDTGKDAEFQVFGGSGGFSKTILASAIAALTITGNEIAANTITAGKLNVATLSAITAAMGTLTSGQIQLGTGTLGSNFTGVVLDKTGLSYGGDTYHLLGLNNEAAQFGLRTTDGVGMFGGGKVILNAAGIRINTDDYQADELLKFLRANGTDEVLSFLTGYSASAPGYYYNHILAHMHGSNNNIFELGINVNPGYGTSYPMIYMSRPSTGDSDASITFRAYALDMILKDAGVGIGTNSPDNLLHIYDGAYGGSSGPWSGSFIVIESDGSAALEILSGGGYQGQIRFMDDGDAADMGYLVYAHAATPYMFFGVDNTEIMRLLSNRVGIGKTPADGLLDLNLATEDLAIVDAGSAGATQQDWIEVKVGGNTGYLRVFASK